MPAWGNAPALSSCRVQSSEKKEKKKKKGAERERETLRDCERLRQVICVYIYIHI